MIKLHYADGFVVTSEALADAVMSYARALASRSTADLVTIPILDDESGRSEATLLIGPASQLFTTPHSGPSAELFDEDVVNDLRARARDTTLDPAASLHPLDDHELPEDPDYWSP